MLPIATIWRPIALWGGLAAALIIAAVFWWGDTGWSKFRKLDKQADRVVVALRQASDNPKADWETAPGQIVALGESNKSLKSEIEANNRAIDDMAREAVRLRARATELQQIAAKAEAQRRAAYARLSDMAITPGTRNDCMQLLREAEEALDLVREAGI